MLKRAAVFAALIGWCWALLAIRIVRAHHYYFLFLVWNLFLAAIPFAAALLFQYLDRRSQSPSAMHAALRPAQWSCLVIWLLFLPNAPYIVTDFIHLKERLPIPLWYDILLLISAAGTGLLLGYASVMIVHRIVARHFGSVTGWVMALTAMFLSAFGIYLGRFVRFNSWELFTDPIPLLSDIAHRLMNPTDHPRTFVVTGQIGRAHV